ncbi:hypothetical protein AQ750_24100 [Burkholderia pseudomallei]|nr:hypothetical protein AQ736_27070 [Burkholderia pseudomallei]OMS50030.1 hypothetical protein AQ743_11870 [Burkholderia pseudomallei]OMS57192.1 hypothetical protein AQ744_06485 [Burkholderia pseudomallei]OMS65712.1 hypothetical protein AQ745_20575 [Burkholderia pseudomallei]OMS91501.1 hypothetical protein AQ747_23360 [Burkholderia pseudomallei]
MSDNEDNARRMSARPCTPRGAGAWAEAAHAGWARGGAFAPPPRPAASEHIAGVKTTMRAARLRRAARSAMLGP